MILLGRSGGRWTASSTPTSRPSPGDEHVAAPDDLDGRPVEQHPPVLGHRTSLLCHLCALIVIIQPR